MRALDLFSSLTIRKGDAMKLEHGHYCYTVMETEYYEGKGYMACVVIEDEPGYHHTGNPKKGVEPWYWGHDFEKAKAAARHVNEERGLTQEDVDRIIDSSFRAQNKLEAERNAKKKKRRSGHEAQGQEAQAQG